MLGLVAVLVTDCTMPVARGTSGRKCELRGLWGCQGQGCRAWPLATRVFQRPGTERAAVKLAKLAAHSPGLSGLGLDWALSLLAAGSSSEMPRVLLPAPHCQALLASESLAASATDTPGISGRSIGAYRLHRYLESNRKQEPLILAHQVKACGHVTAASSERSR